MVIHGTIRGNSCLLFNTNDHKLTVNVREYYSFEPQSQTLRFLRLGVRIKDLREKNCAISGIVLTKKSTRTHEYFHADLTNLTKMTA